MSIDLEKALVKLSLKNGDVVFCDGRAVDPVSFDTLVSPSPEQDDVHFVFVYPEQYKNVEDCIKSMSRDELRKLLSGA